jgi:hypothetical protein
LAKGERASLGRKKEVLGHLTNPSGY